MSVRLKPIEHQVVVITGASSGIGLATARLAASRGARLVVAARNGEALDRLCEEIGRRGGRAVPVVADVADEEDVKRIARTAMDQFGGFDTWINNAAVAIFGTTMQVPIEDQRRLFEVNYWGVVFGSLEAARHLRRRSGAIINVGSVLSDRSLMLQGPYSASKHAVKGFTDALRMELEADGAPISVTLIKPSSIDTPYVEHARNYLDSPGNVVPPPIYDPSLVARAIVFAAEHHRRTLVVGAGGYALSVLGNLFPRLTDLVMEATMYGAQTTSHEPRGERRDNLYEARQDFAEHASIPGTGPHRTSSVLLEAQMHPAATLAIGAGVGLVIALLSRASRPSRRRSAAQADAEYRARNFERYQELRRRRGNGRSEETAGPGRYRTGGRERPAHERPLSH